MYRNKETRESASCRQVLLTPRSSTLASSSLWPHHSGLLGWIRGQDPLLQWNVRQDKDTFHRWIAGRFSLPLHRGNLTSGLPLGALYASPSLFTVLGKGIVRALQLLSAAAEDTNTSPHSLPRKTSKRSLHSPFIREQSPSFKFSDAPNSSYPWVNFSINPTNTFIVLSPPFIPSSPTLMLTATDVCTM